MRDICLFVCVKLMHVRNAAAHTSPDPSCHRAAMEGNEGTNKLTVCESVSVLVRWGLCFFYVFYMLSRAALKVQCE